jgi:hypothetical protein
MTPEAKIGGLLFVGMLAWRLGFTYPTVDVDLWQYITYSGGAFLAIGLVRDVIIKLTAKSACAPRRAGEKMICLESLVGPMLVFGGLVLLAVGVHNVWRPPVPMLGIYLAALFIVSGMTKDIVIVFRREKNHINVIPW